MPANTPPEGKNVFLNMLYNNADPDRGTNLQIGLFTNTSAFASLAAVTEPSGGGYARQTLIDGSWPVSAGVAAHPSIVFTAAGSNYSGPVYGYFIATTGTVPRILHSEVDPLAPVSIIDGESYTIDLSSVL